MNGNDLAVAILHRPIRGAWLLHEKSIGTGSGTHALSQLAEACCRWWEGRNSVLIHVNDAGLGETAQRILRRHDPDEIIALGNISETIIEAVDRIVYPFVFSQQTYLR